MELSKKQKTVKVIGAAESALTKLEENIRAVEARGKTPPKEDKQLLKSIYRALDTLKSNPFAGDEVKVVSVVFEIADHEKYNKIFGYRKK